MFAEKERSGIHVSDEVFKMATTDAISVACKLLGVGADVYWDSDKTKYTCAPNAQPAAKMNVQDYPERIRDIIAQCNRTGVTIDNILERYKLDNIEAISDLQLKSCMKAFAKTPDRTS